MSENKSTLEQAYVRILRYLTRIYPESAELPVILHECSMAAYKLGDEDSYEHSFAATDVTWALSFAVSTMEVRRSDALFAKNVSEAGMLPFGNLHRDSCIGKCAMLFYAHRSYREGALSVDSVAQALDIPDSLARQTCEFLACTHHMLTKVGSDSGSSVYEWSHTYRYPFSSVKTPDVSLYFNLLNAVGVSLPNITHKPGELAESVLAACRPNDDLRADLAECLNLQNQLSAKLVSILNKLT